MAETPLQKMAILHPRFPRIGGAENLIASCSEVLLKNNWSVDLFTGEYARGLWPTLDRLNIHQMSTSRKFLRSKYFDAMRFRWQFTQALGTYDLIWAHNYPAMLWAQKAMRKFPRVKGVWYCNEPRRNLYPEITEPHLIDIDRYVPASKRKNNLRYYEMREELLADKNSFRNARDRAVEKRVIRDFGFIQTVSEYVGGLVRQLYGVEAECCYAPVLTPPADVSRIHDGTWTVGCLATFAERKNFLNVFRALEIVAKQNAKIKIKIGVAFPAQLHEYLKSHGLTAPAQFEIADTFKPANLHQFYQSLDLNLYLTLDEPLGLIPIEAALCGTPSLLSDHAGPGELSRLGFGNSVNPMNDELIADAVLKQFPKRLTVHEKRQLQRLSDRHFGVESFLARFQGQIARSRQADLPPRPLPVTTY